MKPLDKTDATRNFDHELKTELQEVERLLIRSCRELLKGDPEKLKGQHIKEIRLLLEGYGITGRGAKSTREKESDAELRQLEATLPEFNFDYDETLHADESQKNPEHNQKAWDTYPLN